MISALVSGSSGRDPIPGREQGKTPRCIKINGYRRIQCWDNPAMDYQPIQGGVEIIVVASCYRNRDKLRPDGPLAPMRT